MLRDPDSIVQDLQADEARRLGSSIPGALAGHCFSAQGLVRLREYLIGERELPPDVVEKAIAAESLGWKSDAGADIDLDDDTRALEGMACVVRRPDSGLVSCVDLLPVGKQLNGSARLHSIGERLGAPWTSDLDLIGRARTVVVVADVLDALALESAKLPRHAAIAIRHADNAAVIDFRFLVGKRVLLCLPADPPDERGLSPGAECAWRIHEALLGLNVSAFMAEQIHEQLPWDEHGWVTLHDLFRAEGADGVAMAMKRIEPWIIPGLPGKFREGRRSRVFLPPHDSAQYWRFRAKEDFVSLLRETIDKETGETKETFADICAFRVAGISRVRIASYTATMTGEQDSQPEMVFSVSVQSPRHGPQLVRKVFEDNRLYKLDKWEEFGAIFNVAGFKRMLSILERGGDLGAREAVNFVGLAWRDGRPVVNEGQDCYFKDPHKQCPYHNLQFPSGSLRDARQVIDAYQSTFQKNAALQLLVWSLGAHLKAFLGFWPHMTIQADKGAGKTTLIKRLERSIAFTMFSSESIKSIFRILGTISYTSHPVGWEEFSTLNQRAIDEAVSALQQTYQFAFTTRGSEKLHYLQTASVLLAGEDVPVRSLLGKVVRVDLTGRKGDMIAEDLPKFPVLQWLQYLKEFTRQQIQDEYERLRSAATERSRATRDDDGARRMTDNYAAIMLAWKLLADFADVPWQKGDFLPDCIETMNDHIAETDGERQPWVWIMDILLSEIDRGEFRHPYVFDDVDAAHRVGIEALILRPSHVMDHIAHTPSLRDRWNALPIKSARVFKRQLHQAGVIIDDEHDRTIAGRRMQHLTALDLEKLAQFGLHASPKERGF